MSAVRFNEELCDGCGICFERCPEVTMEKDRTRRAIRELIQGTPGRDGREILSKCSSCLSCNTYCPHDAGPYFLVLDRFNDLYRKRGAPAIYRFVCPNRSDSIWNTLGPLASAEERALFVRWHENMASSPGIPLILGNYAHLFPHVFDSPLFDGFTLLDPIGHWECGAYLTQAGYTGEVEKIGNFVKRFFDALENRDVMILTDAVHFLLTRFLPERFGISFAPSFSSFTMWLRDELARGNIPLKKRVDKRLAIHDSCYAKAIGAPLFDAARDILTSVGCTILELPHIRDDSYCCGFGRGAADIAKAKVPFEIMKGAMRKLREVEAVGAEGVVTYCTGCMYLLWSARELMGSDVAIYHITEPVTMAMGAYKYDDLSRQRERAWDIIILITSAYTKSLFQKRFPIGDVTDDRYDPRSTESSLSSRLLRAVLSPRPVQMLYAAGFRGLTKIL
jgi:Fe-S oxidoreductase